MSPLSTSSLAPIDQALLPASIRKGGAAARQAYATGLAFEQMLVQQLTQELASSTTSSDGSDGSGSDGTDGTTGGGLMGSDPASSMYAQLLPTALGAGIMSAGGIGIAQQLAQALDPALGAATREARR